MSSKSKNSRRKNQRSNLREKQIVKSAQNEMGMIPLKHNKKSGQKIAPAFRMVKFRFEADLGLLTNSGVSFAYKTLRANDLYDPDPSLLSSSVSGFSDNMRMYNYATAFSNYCRVTFSNNEAFPIKACLVFTNDDPLFGVGTTTQDIIDAGENSLTSNWTQISGKGGQDRSVINLKCNFPEFIGNPAIFWGSNNYDTYYNQSPQYWIYLNILLWSTTNFTSAGVSVQVSFDYSAKLWMRRLVLDGGPLTSLKALQIKQSRYQSDLKLIYDTISSISILDDPSRANERRSLMSRAAILEKKSRELESVIHNPYALFDEQLGSEFDSTSREKQDPDLKCNLASSIKCPISRLPPSD